MKAYFGLKGILLYYKGHPSGYFFQLRWGWSGGAMVLGKLPVPGRPTNLD